MGTTVRDVLASTLVAVACALALAPTPTAAESADSVDNAAYEGIWVSTPYPAQNVEAGKAVTLDITVHNSGLPPQNVRLSVAEIPDRWSAALLGGGRPVSSVFVDPDGSRELELRVSPPEGTTSGTYRFVLVAESTGGRFELPVELTLGDVLPATIALDPEFPELTGAPTSSFDFSVDVTNESGRDELVRLAAEAPQGFRVSFKEEFGSQELTSLPVEAGATETVEVSVDVPERTEAGSYSVVVRASTAEASDETSLTLDVTGQPRLRLSGPDGRVSAEAEAGSETPVELVLRNTGSAPAHDVSLSSNAPSGWKVEFDPEALDIVPPDDRRTVTALVTPAAKAIAGDYMVGITARAEGLSDSTDFRITVRTSTLWGLAGIGVVAAALVVLAIAVIRYGRR